MTTSLVILIYKQNGRLGDKVNYIQVERTLIIDDAMVGVGNDAYFNIENKWIHGKVVRMNDKQVKIQDLNSGKSYIMLPKNILAVSDKAPY